MKYKNRYLFLKRTYKNTIILFESNNKYIATNKDRELLKCLKINKYNELDVLYINYLVINNLTIKIHKEFINNRYIFYYQKYRLNKLIKYIYYK